jgi:hypothetical protein
MRASSMNAIAWATHKHLITSPNFSLPSLYRVVTVHTPSVPVPAVIDLHLSDSARSSLTSNKLGHTTKKLKTQPTPVLVRQLHRNIPRLAIALRKLPPLRAHPPHVRSAETSFPEQHRTQGLHFRFVQSVPLTMTCQAEPNLRHTVKPTHHPHYIILFRVSLIPPFFNCCAMR